jgi:anti-sigma B factor antagonist
MKPGLTIAENTIGTVQLLKVGGYLDGHTAVELERKMSAVMKAGHSRLVMDLSALTYIASAGVGVLINIQHQAKKSGGGLHLVNPSPSVREIFSILGLQTILAIHDSVDAGVQAAAR